MYALAYLFLVVAVGRWSLWFALHLCWKCMFGIPAWFRHCCISVYVCVLLPNRFAYTRPPDVYQQDSINGRRRLFQEIKCAKSCFVVVILYGARLLPTSLGAFFVALVTDTGVYSCWLFTLYIINSSMNSVAFFWTKTLLRTEAWKIIKSSFPRLSPT